MLKREFLLYLEDILESIEKIERYIKNLTYKEFTNNEMVIDAVVRNFEIIGEAANNLPNSYYEKYSKIPWKKMYRLRNIVTHNYHGIDNKMIWEIAKNNLPQNKLDLIYVIKNEK